MADALSAALLPATASVAGSSQRMTLLVFNGDFDRLQGALMVALGAVATGMQVTMYYSFWAVLSLKQRRQFRGKTLLERIFTAIMPAGAFSMGTSRMNFCGAGPYIFGAVMKQRGIQTPVELMENARELGVRFVVCPVSMEMMGISTEELIPGTEVGGVTSFVADAAESQVTLVF